MARIPYLAKSDLKPEDQELLAREINLNRALVNSPNAARAFSRLGGFIRSTSRLMMNGLKSSSAISFGSPHWCSLRCGPATITERPE